MRISRTLHGSVLGMLCVVLFAASHVGYAQGSCDAPDNGGTATLPAGCSYLAPFGTMVIVNGLAPGDTIKCTPTWTNFSSIVTSPGGSLGGDSIEFHCTLEWTMQGTGSLSGFTRVLSFQIPSSGLSPAQAQTAPRTPGSPVQSFATDMVRLQGQLPPGDPDFDLLRITAGTGFGMPSPGHTTLTKKAGGTWNVDSFFDITYRIDFVGHSGSILGGHSGSTTATIRMQQGEPYSTCLPSDNGSGSVDLPAPCPYTAIPVATMNIINGLAPGDSLKSDPTFDGFHNIIRTSGGTLGGEIEQYLKNLGLLMRGTGSLSTFTRAIAMQNVQCEVHTAPRTPGNPIQGFDTDMFQLQGQITGDPDFDLLRITAGTGFSMPSPGHTTLTRMPDGTWNVDSFFDITYRIDFVGHSGGPLGGMSGSTTGTIRMQQGAHIDQCVPSDNGIGTVDLPAPCPYTDFPVATMNIIDGLAPGDTIKSDPTHNNFTGIIRTPGGTLGGEIEQFLSSFILEMSGTGTIATFSRPVTIPAQCEVHTAPRTPGSPVQSFATEMFQLQGQITGDPDFDLLRITAGSGFGMPSPGHTTLTKQAGPLYTIDSFFDITYRIDFIGHSPGPLGGMSGSTTGTIRMQQGVSGGGSGPTNDLEALSVDRPADGLGVVPELTPFRPKATFKNLGAAGQSAADVRFEILNGLLAVVYSNDKQIAVAPSGGTAQATFDSVPGGLAAGTYTSRVIARLVGDENPSNDTITGSFKVQLKVTLSPSAPITENFEDPILGHASGGIGWISVAAPLTPNDWTRGTPTKTQISAAHSGASAYVTKTSGNYSDNQESYLHAPVLNLTSLVGDLYVAFYTNFKSEAKDGCVLEMSTDGGASWARVDSTLGTGSNFNTVRSIGWYNGSAGGGNMNPAYWGGGAGGGTSSANYSTQSAGWILSSTTISGVAGLSAVQFRWHYSSDGSTNSEGWAIDDVTFFGGPVLYPNPGPLNMGLVYVGNPKTDTIVVTNTGTQNLNITGVVLEGPTQFVLNSGGNVTLSPTSQALYVITYTPTDDSVQQANLIFTNNGFTSPDTVLITAVGSTAATSFITLVPDSIFNENPLKLGTPKKAAKRKKHLYPNWTNLIEETVAQGGFQPLSSESDSAGGMRIGASHMARGNPGDPLNPKWKPIKDSANIYCWIRMTKWDFKHNLGKSASVLQKTLRYKNLKNHLTGVGNVPRGLDLTGVPGQLLPIRKPLKKQLTKLDPKKTPNKLFAELLALKFNIAASQLGKTPPGLGELVYGDVNSPFDGMSVTEIAREADSAMTYWHNLNQTYYDSLHATIARINLAFSTPLDTIGGSFEVGGTLYLTAGVDLSTVPFLTPGAPPQILRRTSTATETEEDFEDEEWDDEPEDGIPVAAKLYQNYPNPFNPTTTVSFRLAAPSLVTLKVYNVLGQEVATLLDGEQLDEGYQTVEFNPAGLSSGVYFYRVDVQDQDGELARVLETKKMLLIK